MAITINANANLQEWESTSVSSQALPTATTGKVFTVDAGKRFLANDTVQATALAAKYPTFIIGTVGSYSDTSLTINPTNATGRIFSKSSVTIGAGSKTFAVGSRYSDLFTSGDAIRISSRASTTATNFMVGTITSYNIQTGNLVVNVTSTGGSGTLADWVMCSDGTFTNWDISPQWNDSLNITNNATLSISATPKMEYKFINATTRGTVSLSNSSSTTPLVFKAGETVGSGAFSNTGIRLEQNGLFKTRGNFIQVGTGAASAAQTLTIPSSIDYPSYVEVEVSAGAGNYDAWQIVPFDYDESYNPGFYVPKTEVTSGAVVGDYVWYKGATKTIECGNGINGNVFPSGAKVRIPNIHLACDLQEPTTLIASTLQDCNLSGGYTNTTGTKIFYSTSGTVSISAGVPVTIERISDATSRMTATVLSYSSVTQQISANITAVAGPATATYNDWRLLNGRNMSISDTSYNSASLGTTNLRFWRNGEIIFATARSGNALTGIARNANRSSGFPLMSGGNKLWYVADNNGTNNPGTRVQGFDTAASGSVDLENTSCSRTQLDFTDPSYIRLNRVGTSMNSQIRSSLGEIDIDKFTVGFAQQPNSSSQQGLRLNAILGNASFKNIKVAGSQPDTAGNSGYILETSNLPAVLAFENIVTTMFSNRRGSNGGASLSAMGFANNYKPHDFYIIGLRWLLGDTSNTEWYNFYNADEPNGNINVGNYTDQILSIFRSYNCIFRNFLPIGSMRLSPTSFLAVDTLSINLIFNNADFSINNNAVGLTSINGAAGSNCVFANFKMGVTSATLANTFNRGTSGLAERNITLRNITTTTQGTSGGNSVGYPISNGLRIEGCTGWQSYYLSAGNNIPSYKDAANYYVFKNTGTGDTGRLSISFAAEGSNDLYDFVGDTYQNNTGRMFLESDLDEVTIKSVYPIRCMLSGIAIQSIVGANTGSLTLTFRYCQWGDDINNASWQTLDDANWATVTSTNQYVGINLQIKVVGSGAVVGRYLDLINLDINTDANYLPAASEIAVSVTNAVSGATFAVIKTVGNTVLNKKNTTGTSDSLLIPFYADGNTTAIINKVRKFGYVPYSLASSYYFADVSFAASMVTDTQLTVLNTATISAYTTLETVEKIYDYCSYYVNLSANILIDTLVTKSGTDLNFGSYNVVVDKTAASVFNLTGNTITIKADSIDAGTFTTTGTITAINGADLNITYTASGTTSYYALGSVSGFTVGSRIQVYNVTTATEIYNGIPVSSPLLIEYINGVNFTTGDTVRVRLSYQNGVTANMEEEYSVVAAINGWTIVDDVTVDSVYVAYGVDGSTVTEFSFDGVNLQIDINDSNNTTEIQRIGAWYHYYITTADGIRNLFGAIAWDSINVVEIDTSVVNLKLDNTKAQPLLLVGGRIYRSDSATVIASGSNSIHIDYSPVYSITQGTGLTEEQSAILVNINNNSGLIPALL